MIVTVTPNTSIDKAYTLAGPFNVATVMRVSEVRDSAGGKGLNASRAIHNAGEDLIATGFVGGFNGKRLLALLDDDGISHDFVETSQETRSCINVLDEKGTSTEFLEPGRPLTQGNFDALLKKLHVLAAQADAVTISGSLPKGLPEDAYIQLINCVKTEGALCIVDTSGETLKQAVSAHPDMVKPNSDEIAQLLGRSVTSLDEVVEAAAELHRQGIAYVVCSLGGDGAILACEDGVFRGRAPKIEVLNPVGAGDTLTGSFAVALARHMSTADALKFAMARASASCLHPMTGRYELKVAQELEEQTVVEKIK